MAEKRVVVRMTKHFNNNLIGDVCSFSEATAEHILSHKGAEKLAVVDPAVERYDVASGKVVPLKASAKAAA